MTQEKGAAGGPDKDHASTRVISHSFELEGIRFSWWAVDESPSLVTVSSQWFGSKSEFTRSQVEAKARELAARILGEHREKVQEIRALHERRAERRSVS